MTLRKKYLLCSVMIVLMLCMAQIRGSTVLILACMALFLLLLGWCCVQNHTLPILLFFLPWSPMMRASPSSFSFFTIGLVLVCLISVVKKQFRFRRYHIAVGIALTFMTLLSKLLDGSGIGFDYIAFIMLMVLFPVVKEEHTAQEYDFFQTLIFLSLGIIIAALCAQRFAGYGGISRYITVHSYSTITRFCGFYGDPNFYTAQITAALGGGFYGVLKEVSKRRITVLGILLFLLLYCGFLSGSKSFVLVTAAIVVIWAVELLRMHGKAGRKIVLIIAAVFVSIYIATSALFGGWIDILVTRFSFSSSLSSLTTHRTDLWRMYIEEILGNGKILFVGNGFTNVKLNGRASHNTVLQAIFQFGILGMPFLVAWIICFFREIPRRSRWQKKKGVTPWILLTGVFLPWMAIDILFFDELFLFLWYVFMAMKEMRLEADAKEENNILQNGISQRRRLRLIWK